MGGESTDAELWEISENLRADPPAIERARLVVRRDEVRRQQRERDETKPVQLAQVSDVGGRGHKSGLSDSARELGITREELRRAKQIDSLTPEAKEAAREVGLDDNQSALLEASKLGLFYQSMLINRS